MERAEFAGIFRAIVTAPDFRYQLRDAAAEGVRVGALTPQERVALETRAHLPAWLKQDLGYVEDYPVSTSYERTRVVTGVEHTHRPPRLIGEGWLPGPFADLSVRTPDVHVTRGGPARLLTANFLSTVELQDGLVAELSTMDNLWGWQLAEDREFLHLPGHLLVLVVEGSSLFSHWLLDTVPRFGVLERAGIDLSEFDHVLVANSSTPFHRETFERLGIAEGQVTSRQIVGPLVSCDSFTHVSAVREDFMGDEWVFDDVHRVFGVDSVPERGRRLWISRAGATRRRLLGEEALKGVLDRFGFEVLRTEELGVGGGAQLCATASVIAGPHGAGFANVSFMPPGGQVLEIYGAHLATEGWRISQGRGVDYACLQGTDAHGRGLDEEEVAQMSFFERNHADIHLTPDRLHDALVELVGEPPPARSLRRRWGRRRD